ncbi:MAG: ATP-dependent Clp protease ATP-binding subunit ClpA [Bdellovibrionales bacterium]|nr:ATP-dependent Clp protease ATP-binding subunit ClpA [Bdellovibrionales bacterium]
MIGKRAETVMNRAIGHAVNHAHEYFTLEHVLWSLLEESDIAETIRACGGDPIGLRTDLDEYLKREIPHMKDASATSQGEQPVATLAVQRMIQRALFQVQSSGKDEIRPSDLFVALFQAKDSQALYLIQKQGIQRLDVLNYISHGMKRDEERPEESESEEEGQGEETPRSARGSRGGGSSNDPLKEYAENLNEKAKAGKIDPILGRDNEIERMVQTLCRRRKNNPLLVGEAGVGKTALAEGLALRISEGNIPDLLEKAVVYSLDLGHLIAGAKFRGDFEQRLKKILDRLKKKGESGEIPILFIDEIHTIIGAGSVNGSALDAANLLKPMLSSGELRCIGSTTYAEFRNVFEKDTALNRRFQKIDVVEPSLAEATNILLGLRPKFEEFHHVKYSNEAIATAVELSSKYITDRFLPDKAIDVIDEAGAKMRLKTRAATPKPETEEGTETAPEASAETASAPVSPAVIDQSFIEEIIAQIARIPPRSVSTSQKARLQNLDRDLKLAIFGQNHAIDSLVTSIRLARSGLRGGDKPIGSFLLCGPTGTGKTEVSKQLAHALGVQFLRFDMSEYSERHTVSRLIGAPPGYVGFDQQGLLTGAVLKHPHAVVLLDEVEKAHPEVWNILLQVMDHGTLTDNNGRKVDFRNTIILMTSNVGSRDIEKRSVGFGGLDAVDGKAAAKAVEQTFTPEFRNRLDAIIYFNPLDPVTVGNIVGKQLVELETQLLAREVEIEVDADVRTYLAEKGYDRQLGARPMQRLIQDEIKKPLSESILFGELEHGGTVHVSMKDGKPAFEIKGRKASPEDKRPAPATAGGENPSA